MIYKNFNIERFESSSSDHYDPQDNLHLWAYWNSKTHTSGKRL